MNVILILILTILVGGSRAAAAPAEAEAVQPRLLPLDRPGFGATPEAQNFRTVCPSIRIEESKEIDWGGMEERLICGDGNKDQVGAPWSDIPPNQAAYFLRGFLQARGYHQPQFIQDGTVLFVKVGQLSRLDNFRLRGGPPSWDPPKRRLVRGSPLTPPLLNDLQGWALSQIKDEGYACATDEGRADPLTGDAIVEVTPGELKRITGVDTSGDTGLTQGALDRYNAFRVGGIYRQRLIDLTKRRTEGDGFLQSINLAPKCVTGPSVRIDRNVVLGTSRSVRIGAGGNTDEGPLVRAIVRQTRIGESASSATFQANLSRLNDEINHQVAQARFHWFYAPGEARSYVEPSIIYEHQAEDKFDLQATTAKVVHGWNYEFVTGQLELRAGPNLLVSKLSRGVGDPDVTLPYAETTLRWTSHDFEYFVGSPRNGETLEATVLAAQQNLGSKFTFQKFRVTGQKLWPVLRYDPPLLILATRFDVNAIFSPDSDISTDLPKSFLSFLGGERDLRGYDRTSLPRNSVGALSSATISGEARLHKVIFRRADVFAFLDAGEIGGVRFQLREPLFLSPGLGFRWESPVGVLRTYIAQRFVAKQPEGEAEYDKAFRLGFTFGEEF